MKKKYIVEISEVYSFQIDDNVADCCYVSIDDLDEKILTMIDSDDIHSWTPVGGKEFVEKFTKLYSGENVKPILRVSNMGFIDEPIERQCNPNLAFYCEEMG